MFMVEIDEKIVGKGGVHFYPERGYASLYCYEVLPKVKGLGVAISIYRAAIGVIQDRYTETISTIRIGRYAKSEAYRKSRGKDKTLFDRIAGANGVVVEQDEWGWRTNAMVLYSIIHC